MTAPDPALRLIGLAARAGTVFPGTERVREAARAGRLRFAVLAADASANALDKVVPLLNARGIEFRLGFDRERLGAAVGRSPLSAVGIGDASLAARVRELLEDEDSEGSGAQTGARDTDG